MIPKLNSSISGHVCIIFELPASVWADRVYLTGDFNDWCEDDIPLRQARDGTWRVTLDLPAGQRFHFRYLVDGQWQTDWSSDGSVTNSFGSQNSIIDTELPEFAGEPERIHEAHVVPAPFMPSSNRLRYPLPNSGVDERNAQAQTRPAA